MIILSSITPFLDPGDWFVAFDLKKASFHVAVHQRHRQFLTFLFNIIYYQFMVYLSACMLPCEYFQNGAEFLSYASISLPGQLASKRYIQAPSTFQSVQDLMLLQCSASIDQTGQVIFTIVQRTKFIGLTLDFTVARAFVPQDRFHTT